jgi:hypothetical protein
MEELIPPSTKFSNVQLELLKLFAQNVSDEELIEVKNAIKRVFANAALEKIAAYEAANQITSEVHQLWLNEKS